MNEERLSFGAASIATILWTRNGFTPNSKNGVVDQGKELITHLKDKDIINGIITKMPAGTRENIKGQLCFVFNDNLDNEYIEIVDLHNLSYERYDIKNFNTRIYVCNHEKKRRAKIVILEDLDFKDKPLNSEGIITLINTVSEFQDSVSRYVFDNIPQEFGLGDIIYKSNIISMESDDIDIDGIIDSIYDVKEERFIRNPRYREIPDKKFADAYQVLLSHREVISSGMSKKSITAEMNEHKVKQSNMIFYQQNGGRVPAKLVNYEVANNYRIISSLTKPYQAPLVTNRLQWDWLSLT